MDSFDALDIILPHTAFGLSQLNSNKLNNNRLNNATTQTLTSIASNSTIASNNSSIQRDNQTITLSTNQIQTRENASPAIQLQIRTESVPETEIQTPAATETTTNIDSNLNNHPNNNSNNNHNTTSVIQSPFIPYQRNTDQQEQNDAEQFLIFGGNSPSSVQDNTNNENSNQLIQQNTEEWSPDEDEDDDGQDMDIDADTDGVINDVYNTNTSDNERNREQLNSTTSSSVTNNHIGNLNNVASIRTSDLNTQNEQSQSQQLLSADITGSMDGGGKRLIDSLRTYPYFIVDALSVLAHLAQGLWTKRIVIQRLIYAGVIRVLDSLFDQAMRLKPNTFNCTYEFGSSEMLNEIEEVMDRLANDTRREQRSNQQNDDSNIWRSVMG
ncbi:MAG: hypothetical protein EZS28_031561 [Streblomastix strix]|uniref:Uncharacterized protein n=1 Tax=Streblomastix strix TaxID=222440 RepID=A0A5J4USK1_9EUKA|nr:MAG: hypothetical protein EZS28_031561 [Streblomastix strix]